MNVLILAAYLVSAVLFMMSLKWLASPKTARKAMLVSMLGMALAVAPTLVPAVRSAHESETLGTYLGVVLGAIALGAVIGLVGATKVKMTAMPQMVGLFNGFGGGASLLVAMVEYLAKAPRATVELGGLATVEMGPALDVGSSIPIHLSVVIGGITLTGSLVAFGKLQGTISGKPILFTGQHFVNLALLLGAVALGGVLTNDPGSTTLFLVMAGLALVLGFLVVIPIGGADMPVVISLLNSYSGLAVASTGFVLKNNVLIIVGSLVGASGLILTRIMCKAMNRSLANVMFGGFGAAPSAAAGGGGGAKGAVKEGSAEEAATIMANAQSMIIVPGYGMAVAQAQHAVRELANLLEAKGVTVKYAIHPVAGRMPGHMNVLLAEANVPYDQLFELDAINDEFQNTDVSLVVGANDVVNPAAKDNPGSPIYGMPVLNVELSKAAIILKRSMNPGFAGIDNELFVRDNSMMVFGDAKQTLTAMSAAVKEGV